jgi:hypothetical protein
MTPKSGFATSDTWSSAGGSTGGKILSAPLRRGYVGDLVQPPR